MPQLPGRPAEAKKLIDATVPGTPMSSIQNISPEAKKKMMDGWNAKAAQRAADVARETAAPKTPSRVLRFELHQFGRYWQAFVLEPTKNLGKKGGDPMTVTPLLGSPSLLSSALDAMEDAMLQRANRA